MGILSEEELTPSAWISVADKMPDTLVNVTVNWYRENYGNFTTRGYWNGHRWDVMSWTGSISNATVTHWMPLPPPPATEGLRN